MDNWNISRVIEQIRIKENNKNRKIRNITEKNIFYNKKIKAERKEMKTMRRKPRREWAEKSWIEFGKTERTTKKSHGSFYFEHSLNYDKNANNNKNH